MHLLVEECFHNITCLCTSYVVTYLLCTGIKYVINLCIWMLSETSELLCLRVHVESVAEYLFGQQMARTHPRASLPSLVCLALSLSC